MQNIDAAGLKRIIRDRNKQFIDVRTPMEFQGQRIKPFKNIPLQALRSNIEKLDRDKEVVLICRSGARSMRAARILKRAGFTQLTNVVGGINQWRG